MKPTEKEIENAHDLLFIEKVHPDFWDEKIFKSAFKRGFKLAIEWLLNWQKTQPLTVYYVIDNKVGIVAVFKTEESAQKGIESLKINLPLGNFYIKASIIN